MQSLFRLLTRSFDRLIPPAAPVLPPEMRPQPLPHPAQAGLLAALLYLR